MTTDKPLQIGLVGAGNLAWNFVHGLLRTPHRVVQVLSRGGESAVALADEFGIEAAGQDPATLRPDLDLVLVATSDHSVPAVAAAYAPYRGPDTIFAHTSGSMPLASLDALGGPRGVFYPMQTFTKGRPTHWPAVPIFLEGSAEVRAVLRPLAELLSDRVRDLDSEGRLRLHLGAVFASNFTNYMLLLAEQMVKGLGDADVQIYASLIREGIEKALAMGPEAAQTGPARRGDQVTMEKHLELLREVDAELYATLSARIGDHFKIDSK